MPDFPIVDTHLHLFDLERLDYPWLAGAPKINRTHLLADYDAATFPVEVDTMVFLQCEVRPDQFLQEAAFVAEATSAGAGKS